ncbi:MAG: hypothetical protein H6707_17660 [Deltaproteobacteria bacterium]|nr:hypothetical protein [Deltaproteobacteria bacterium]
MPIPIYPILLIMLIFWTHWLRRQARLSRWQQRLPHYTSRAALLFLFVAALLLFLAGQRLGAASAELRTSAMASWVSWALYADAASKVVAGISAGLAGWATASWFLARRKHQAD